MRERQLRRALHKGREHHRSLRDRHVVVGNGLIDDDLSPADDDLAIDDSSSSPDNDIFDVTALQLDSRRFDHHHRLSHDNHRFAHHDATGRDDHDNALAAHDVPAAHDDPALLTPVPASKDHSRWQTATNLSTVGQSRLAIGL